MSATEAKIGPVLEALAKVPMFSHLEDKDLRKLARLCTLQSYEEGKVIFEEGGIGLKMYVIASGKVDTYKTRDGKKVDLGRVEAGGVLGQIALLDDQPRSASAVALEPTQCLLLTRDSFDTLVKRDPAIAWCLVPGLAGRVRELQDLAIDAGAQAGAAAAGPGAEAAAPEPEPEAGDEDDEEDDDETSDLESALFKMMRLQYGLMAGAAKGVTEVARLMETFLDSLADETDIKAGESWRDMIEKVPEAMVTATRSAMDEGEKMPKEMVDVYRRYTDDKD